MLHFAPNAGKARPLRCSEAILPRQYGKGVVSKVAA
jgi:hypothetical protein